MRWGLGLDTHPTKVASMGVLVYPGDERQCPQVQSVMYEYAGRDVLMTFETRSGLTNTEAGMGAEYPFIDKQNVVGVIFLGTEGHMIIPDYSSYYTFLGPKRQKGLQGRRGRPYGSSHFANFVKAVRSGKTSDLNANVEHLHLPPHRLAAFRQYFVPYRSDGAF